MEKRNPVPTSNEIVQKVRFVHPTGKSSPVGLLSIAGLRDIDPDIYKPTRLEFHAIMLITEGLGRHWVDFEEVKVERGDVLHIQPSQVHSFDQRSLHNGHLLIFLPEAVQDPDMLVTLNFHMRKILRPKPVDFSLLLEIIKLYETQQSSRGSINADRLSTYCVASIITAIDDILTETEFLQPSPPSKTAGQLVYKFETLLQEHHASHRDLDWYVSQLAATARTLARACHKVRGQSPKKLIDARITLEAKRQLILTTNTVEEISFSLGFSEATNFVKFFKRIAGQPPEGFRKSQLAQ